MRAKTLTHIYRSSIYRSAIHYCGHSSLARRGVPLGRNGWNAIGENTMTEKTTGDSLRGNLDLMVLSVLTDERLYGYLILQRLNEASGGRVSVQAGTLYPLLHRLEADKRIRSRWDDSTGRRRKWYELTAHGRKQLVREAHQWQEYAECLQKMLAPVLGTGPEAAGC